MKNKILLFVLLSSTGITFSQLPTPVQVVQAPALEAQAAKEFTETMKQSKEAVEQTKELKKSYDLLDETRKALEQVTDVLFEVNTTTNIIKSQARIITRANYMYQDVKNLKGLSVEGAASITNYITETVLASEDLTRLTKDLLTTGIFKMNDAERMQMLNDIEKKIEKQHEKLNLIRKKVNYLKTVNRYQEMFKN